MSVAASSVSEPTELLGTVSTVAKTLVKPSEQPYQLLQGHLHYDHLYVKLAITHVNNKEVSFHKGQLSLSLP
jgi:hypothetical protein